MNGMSRGHEGERKMKQSCDRVGPELLDLIEPASSSEEHESLWRHVDGCDACSAELEALRAGFSRMEGAAALKPASALRTHILSYAREPGTMYPRARRSIGGRARFGIGGTLAAASAAFLAMWFQGEPPSAPPQAEVAAEGLRLDIGEPFPDFVAMDVESGVPVSLSDLEGEVVLLNIWATWCGPCESEMPSMERLYQEFGPDGFVVVAVSVDQESTEKVRQWVDDRGITFTVLHDREGSFERSFRTVGVPESFVIDRNGVLVAREFGPRTWDSPESSSVIRDLLRGGTQ